MACPHPAPVIADATAAAAQVADLARGSTEGAAVLYLDPEWRLLGRIDFRGSADEVTPPFRTIIAEALRLDAAALILAHNHPSGDSRPSAADLAYTRDLVRIATTLDIVIADHLILAGKRVVSLRGEGLL